MSFVVIAGQTYPALKQGASENKPEEIGQIRRAFGGNPRTSIRAEKAVYSIPLSPMLPATFTTLKTNTANGVLVACSGDFNGGVTLNYFVRIVSCGYFKPDNAQGMYRTPVLELHQE